jgi:hypothetical protein
MRENTYKNTLTYDIPQIYTLGKEIHYEIEVISNFVNPIFICENLLITATKINGSKIKLENQVNNVNSNYATELKPNEKLICDNFLYLNNGPWIITISANLIVVNPSLVIELPCIKCAVALDNEISHIREVVLL